MRVRFFVFLFLILFVYFPLYSVTTNQQSSNSGSGTLGKPSVTFKEWQIGRSDKNTDSNNDNPTSFITSTGTACHFTASVGYDGNQGDNVSPIDVSTISWTITGQYPDPESMALVTSKKNWSGAKHPKLDPGTSFNVVGTISVPAYTPTAKPDICKDENNHRRHERTPLHRGNKKLGFTLKFTADTEDGQEVETELVLKADDIDQVRQEYVDLNRPIPKRGEFKSEDTYDFGHYEKMLNEGLSGWYQKWINQMNIDYRGTKDALKKSDFTLNSGYRNPHHNHHHAGSSGLSSHMYGYALDVEGKDLDDNGTLDRQDMVDAAYAILQPNRARWSQLYSGKTHVHADWAPDLPMKWKHRRKTSAPVDEFSLPRQGTDSPLESGNPNNNGNTNGNTENPGSGETTPQTRPCGHSLTASGDHSEQASCSTDSNCISTNFYLCKHTNHTYSQQPCGHRYNPGSSSAYTHRSVNYPCDEHSYYACQTPSTSSHAWVSSCPSTDTHGNTCTTFSGYYQCSQHSHSYPSANNNDGNSGNSGNGNLGNGNLGTQTVACGGVSYTGCSGASSRTEHHVPLCSNGCGNGYWTCSEYAYRHTDEKTCKRSGCSATLTRCQNGPSACVRPGKPANWHWL